MPIQGLRTQRFRNFTRFEERDIQVITHSHFGDLWAPRTFAEFAVLIDDVGWQTPGGWRGQAKIDWLLDSGAVRRLREPRPEDDPLGMSPEYLEKVVAEYEQRLLSRARMAGHSRREGRELSDLELLGILQHHGAATRLLDFTRNVWVAAWFASTKEPDEHGLVVGLDLAGSFAVRDPATLSHTMSGLLREAGDRLSFWRPAALSPRMPAQHAFFLWGTARYRPWGSVGGEPLRETEQRVSRALPGFICIAVPPALKAELQLHWGGLFGYSSETLFPDLDGFARSQGATVPLGELSPYELLEGDVEEEPPDEPLPSDEDDDESMFG